jgi:uncharacterized protein
MNQQLASSSFPFQFLAVLDANIRGCSFELMFEASISPVKSRLLAAGVRRLGVFGSMARGDAGESSDVDVLVGFAPDQRTYDNLFAVGEALEEAFHRRVDIVTEDALSPHIGPHILREVKYVDLGN